MALLALFWNAADVSRSMHAGNDLRAGCLWPVQPRVSELLICVNPRSSLLFAFYASEAFKARNRRDERGLARIRLGLTQFRGYYGSVSRNEAHGGNERPDVENIRFGKRRKNIDAHRLDKRQSSFIA